MKAARAIKEKYSSDLLSRPGVWGVGVEADDRGRAVLVVHVDAEHPDLFQHLPGSLEGLPLRIVTDAPFSKQT